MTVKVPATEVKVARNRRPGLLRPDYSEKSQSRRTSTSSAGVKVDVTLAPGLQVKDPSKRPKSATSLDPDVFRDSAAGALPAIWAKLPQSLVLRGEDKCDARALPLVGCRSESVWKGRSRGGVAGGWNAACRYVRAS